VKRVAEKYLVPSQSTTLRVKPDPLGKNARAAATQAAMDVPAPMAGRVVQVKLKQGDKVPITLEFEKAGKVMISLDVGSLGAQGPAGTGAAMIVNDANGIPVGSLLGLGYGEYLNLKSGQYFFSIGFDGSLPAKLDSPASPHRRLTPMTWFIAASRTRFTFSPAPTRTQSPCQRTFLAVR